MAITVEVYVYRHSYCGRQSGLATALVNGGVPPYTYAWSNGSTGLDALGLFPGSYTLTVTDSQMDQATANFTIDLLTNYDGAGAWPVHTMAHCPGSPGLAPVFTGALELFGQTPPEGRYGPHPYTFQHPLLTGYTQANPCSSEWEVYDLLEFEGAAPGLYTIDFWDGAGCPGQVQVMVGPEWSSTPLVQLLNVEPSCASTATGSMTIALQQNNAFTYNVMVMPLGGGDQCALQATFRTQDQGHPGQTYTKTNLAPGDYWVITTNDVLNLYTGELAGQDCRDSLLVTVPSLGTDCGSLTGRVYIDQDANCAMGGAENQVPGTIVEITPGPYYVTTNSSGQYSIGLPFGSYTVAEQHPVFNQSCPGNVTLVPASQTVNIGCAGGQPLDVQLSMANGPARPGFTLSYAIDIDNLTPAATGVVTVTVTLDPALGFVSANPTPSSVAGNVLTWTSPQLVMNQVFQHRDISIAALVPPDVGLLGNTLSTTAQITTTNADGNLANNSASSNQVVTGSYDPNDKLARTSTGSTSVWQLNEDQWIDYTIRFQNTGTDTAFNVIITDTLPPNLDAGSILWGAASHSSTRQVLGGGVVKYIFPNILLPDSNINEPRSHGFVGFRIRPRLPLLPGNEIENIANIYFDFNPPIITEPSVLTVPLPGVLVAPRVMLGGPYVQATQRMNDGLRSAGLLPLTEPYTALGYGHVGGGGESVAPAVLAATGDNAIVDWVVVELRSATSPYTVLATRSALLQRDGDVVATNGTGPVAFTQAAGNYRIALRHRNHLGAMTDAAVALNTSTATLVDLSVAVTATFGTNARKPSGSLLVLWPGDANFDGQVKYTGPSNDRDAVLTTIGGINTINVASNVYSGADVNLDGVVKYVGATNDRDIILQTIGGTVPTAVRTEQVP